MAKGRGSFHPPRARPSSNSYRPGPNTPTDSYRPDGTARGDRYRPQESRLHDEYRPGRDRRHDRREEAPRLPPVRSAVTKTKHERDTNPSTRIHSLKRQLQTQDLPGTVRQEKERELAALLFEQQKTKLKQEIRPNLQRYHFVRFLERQKAEKELKRLIKLRDSATDDDLRSELEKDIHITEVDLNYAKYAPLGDKYISLFPKDDEAKKKKKREKFQMNKLDYGVLNAEQKEELRGHWDQGANIARSASGDKPPMWYEVEKLMKQGEAQLEALRDGKSTSSKQLKTDLATVGGRKDAQLRSANGKELEKAAPGWLNDEGVIDPADLDSDQDDEMGDGGFFEH